MSNQQYDNRNTGALFKNDNKTKPNHPDYRGSYTNEHNEEFWVSAWIKSGRKGNFLSLAFTRKDDQPQQSSGRSRDQDEFLNQNAATINNHRQQARDGRGDMQGAPQRPNQPQPAADFDSFDDDIPF